MTKSAENGQSTDVKAKRRKPTKSARDTDRNVLHRGSAMGFGPISNGEVEKMFVEGEPLDYVAAGFRFDAGNVLRAHRSVQRVILPFVTK